MILKSWRHSTLNQYVVYAKLWFAFSKQGLRPTIHNIVEFLVHLHGKGYNYKQICQARSAVGVLSNIENIGKHPVVKRVMKGMFEENPQFPKYSCVWDVNILFRFFRDLPHQNELPLKILSKKLATLLGILAGGQRSQTIHAIKSTDILVVNDKCIIPIYDPVKQTKDGKHMEPLKFKVFHEEKLCVIQNLTTYLERTKCLRKGHQLFISYQKPYKAVSKDTVTRWVNDMMGKSGIDISRYVTHSCRAAASSYAFKKKVPLKRIMDSCGWSSERTFANHYRKKINDNVTIGEQLLTR